jgi:hypothetical protein
MINRRELLGSAGAVAMLPVLPVVDAPVTSGMPQPHEATLQLGPAHAGPGNHRWARILGGTVTGRGLVGRVQSGRLDWHVDPASGASEARVQCQVLCSDGRVQELCERGLQPAKAGPSTVRFRTLNFP